MTKIPFFDRDASFQRRERLKGYERHSTPQIGFGIKESEFEGCPEKDFKTRATVPEITETRYRG